MTIKWLKTNADGFYEEVEGFGASEHINSSAGVGSAGLPIVLDAAGKIDSSMINLGSIDHGALTGLGDDDHTQYILVDGSRAFSGAQSMGGFALTNLLDPVNAQDAVTKAYTDAVAVGLRPHGNVEVASVANVSVASAPAAIDGITLSSGDRVLLKDQTDPKENGIYDFNGSGSAMTRSEDQDNSPQAEIMNGVFIPQVLQGSVNATKPFVITSVGTGTDGVHTIGVDNIVFEVFTSPSQLQAGDGIDIAANVISVDLLASGGLKILSTELAVEPADFAGAGLVDDGADNLAIDFSTAFNDQKAIAAQDLNSVANGEGASIVGIEDLAGNLVSVNVEDALAELFTIADGGRDFVNYTVGAGGVSKGDLCFVSANDTASAYSTLSQAHRGIGLAMTTEIAAGTVSISANDEVIEGVLVGATAGTPYYWTGSALSSTIPSGSGSHVWLVGIAKNATDLHSSVAFVKKNA